MPARGPTLAVAVVIFLAGVVALARVDLFLVSLPPMLQSVAVAALAVIFSGRGLSSFTPWFRASQSEEPFATAASTAPCVSRWGPASRSWWPERRSG